MTDPAQSLTFLSWVRPALGGLVTGAGGGRAQAGVPITLSASGSDGAVTASQSQTVSFLVAGPADVVGLQPGAIVRRYPASGTPDHESDRCPYVELAEADLPWRYTPAPTPAASSAALHPWLVLLVGVEGDELILTGDRVRVDVSIQSDPNALGDPATAYRFAHVQQDAAGHRVARVLCGRPLQPGTDYLAVLVPAFDASGTGSWTGAVAAQVPVYDAWRFHTAVPAGSFEDLAARLHPGAAPDITGRATMHYPRLPADAPLHVLGALVAPTPDGIVAEDPLPADVAADLAQLRLPSHDEQGRPIVAMPRYGDAWSTVAPDDAVWGRSLNLDPRHRGVAGLGLEVGIRFQEELVDEVMADLGALHEARQRVRNLSLGLTATRSLWRRRVPADETERLWLLGPSMARLVTDEGTVADRATADDRTLPRGTFSAAARRLLRGGPARAGGSTATPAAVLEAVNAPPSAPPDPIAGVPLSDGVLAQLDTARRKVIDIGHVDQSALLAAATDLASNADSRLHASVGQVVTAMKHAVQVHQPVPWTLALTTMAAGDSAVVAGSKNPEGAAASLGETLGQLRDGFTQRADDSDLTELLAALTPFEANDPTVTGVNLTALAGGVGAAFDPTDDDAPALTRVLSTIDGGVDPAQPLAPPELCVGLDRAAWSLVGRAFGDWLLPGIGQLDDNCVISLESNLTFIESFLVGMNSQLLSELRWRNIPVATGCTPVRRFWDRSDTTTGDRADDIVGVDRFAPESPLGDPTHLAAGATGSELVIVVRGDLLLRYPTTLVYLQSAVHPPSISADFDVDPASDAARVLPGFHGQIGVDVVFFGFPSVAATDTASHWLVFEEPPAGYRFANDSGTTATSGHAWAAATLAEPVRVLIRGDSLHVGGQ